MSELALKLYTFVDGVNDTPFPSATAQAVLTDWQYNAKRMGGTPSITGGTIRHQTCLDAEWTEDVYVEYKGEKFFAPHKPTSSYSSQSIMYEHKVDFFSERAVLDNVYFYDVVSEQDSGGKPISNNTKFTFFGTIDEFIVRLNASMARSNTGYSVVLDENQENTDVEKQIKFSEKYISEALQEGFKVFGIPYYFIGKVCHYGVAQSSVLDNMVFEYGRDKSLIAMTKNNANTKIVNRITGVGSEDNIPYYYPNSCEEGIASVDEISSSTITNINVIDDMLLAKKVAKNDVLQYGSWATSLGIPMFYGDGEAYSWEVPAMGADFGGKTVHIVIPLHITFNCTSLALRLMPWAITRPSASVVAYANFTLTPDIVGKTITVSSHDNYVDISASGNIAKGIYTLAFDATFPSLDSEQLIDFSGEDLIEITAIAWKDTDSGDLFQADLSDIGLSIEGTPSSGDTFKRIIVRQVVPQPNLMPSIYRESNGDERFYNATNNTYINPDTGEYYVFPKPYRDGKPKEYIHDEKDIKPSIVNVVNADNEPIDQVIKFAFDENDSDELDENGNYEHPYFFALLHKMDGEFGFNLFDNALEEEEMSIAITSGSLGGCEFVIGVGEDSQKNTVQIVLDENLEPELDEDGHPILKRDANGDVLYGLDGRQSKQVPQSWQNDTRNNEVWVALKKDISTYGIIMPNATYNYKPQEDDEDTFVLLHIDLPKAYILAAEKALEDTLIAFMAESNEEHWNFSIDFSRIYFKETPSVASALDENKRIKIKYNGTTYERYISSYSYKTMAGELLPNISVELAESLQTSSNPIDSAISEISNLVEIQSNAIIGYQQVARLARLALPSANVQNKGNVNLPIYFDGSYAKVIEGLDVPESIRTQKNVEAMWGVSAFGIANMAISGTGGGGTVTAVSVNGTRYTPSNGLITLPDYPSLNGYATENYVASYFDANFTQLNIKNTLGISDWALASTKPSYNFSEIGAKPSTLGGYGISDAHITNGEITLGQNTITPATLNNGKIPLSQIPDAILGQMLYGGTVNGSGVVTLSQNAKDKWGITSLTLTSTNYADYEGAFFIASANGSSGVPSSLGVLVGDWIIATSAGWGKIDNTDAVTGVKGNAESSYRIGNVNITPANIGLGNVENTALSTWVGTNNITTLGTITTGVWNGTAIADTYIASAATWNAKQNALAFDGTYDASTNKVATKSTVTNAINALDYADPNYASGKYVSKVTQTDGLIAVTHESFATPAVTWTAGTTAGPTLKITTDGGDSTAVAIPAANGTANSEASGIVTTGAQTFAGLKTFNGSVNVPKGSYYYKIGELNILQINSGNNTIFNYGTIGAAGFTNSAVLYYANAGHSWYLGTNEYLTLVSSAFRPSRANINLGGNATNNRWATIYGVNGNFSDTMVVTNDIQSSNGNIEALHGGVSAMGIANLSINSGGGQGTLTQIKVNGTALSDVNGVVNIPLAVAGTNGRDGAMSNADKTKLDGIADHANNYTLPVATSDALGGIRIGYGASGKYYAVQLDNNNKAYVYVPWSNTEYTFYDLAFQNDNSVVDTYKPTTSPSKTIKAGSNVTISAASNVITIAATDTTYTFASGDNDGQIKVTPSGGSAQNISVTGLDTAAFHAASDFATSSHTHTTSIAASTGTNQLNLNFGTKYALTAGGTSFIFTMPSNPNTDINVTQTVTTSANSSWRPLILGFSYSDATTFAPSTTTATVYASHLAKFAPSTGILAVVGLNKMGTDGKVVTGSNSSVFNTNGGTTTLATVATSGSYNDLSNKPTIPTVNNGNLYLQASGTTKVTFTANQSGDSTFNIAQGSTNGTIAVGGTDVAVKGLDTAAYKADTYFLAASLKGAANGLAELDVNGLVPSSQLPSYVDDVLEYASKSAFPATGETGKIYVALDTNLTWRWSGSAYVEISPSLALGETSSTAYRGDRGKTAYDHATDASRLTTAKSSGFYKFATTAEGHIASVTAVTASDLTSLIGSTTYAPYNANGYLPLNGGTMTGILTLWGSQYNAYDTGAGALNLNNSDITGVNSILTADLSESWKESIGFKRTNGNYDTFRAADGVFYFGVNNGTEYTAIHSGNIGSQSVNYATTAGSAPASDVYAWAKAATKPSYSFSEISSRQQAYIDWGGPNIVGSVSPLEVATIDDLGHNKFAFASAATITIQYSRDGGNTWLDYGATDAQKRSLLTLSQWFQIGNRTGASNTVNDKLRVILNSNRAGGNIYMGLRRLLLNISTSGSGGCTVKVEHRTIANYNNNVDTWNEIGTYDLSGWSGWNSIPCAVTFGGSSDQTTQSAQVRLTFGVTSVGSTYSNLGVACIRGIGFPLWGSPSTMASTGHLYSYDISQNAAFPAGVSAPSFYENGTALSSKYLGINANAVSATKATQDGDGNTISSTYLKLSGGTITNSSDTPLKINSTHANTVCFSLRLSGITKNELGYASGSGSSNLGTYIYDYTTNKYLSISTSGVLNFTGNTIWHAGNDGSGSGLDADTVDGYHASDFGYNKSSASYDCNEVGTHFAAYRFSASPTNGFPSAAYSNMLVIGGGSDTMTQIGGPYNSQELYFRNGTWYSDGTGSIRTATWQRIVHSGNISSFNAGSATTIKRLFKKESEAQTAVGYYKIATFTHSNWGYSSFTILTNNSYSGTRFNTIFDVRCSDDNVTLNGFSFNIIGGTDISSKLAYLETKNGDNITKIEVFMLCSRYEYPEFFLIAQHANSNILTLNTTDWGDTPDKASSTTMTGNAANTIVASALTTTSKGSSTQPVYFANGVPVACDLSTTYAPYNDNGYLPLNGGRLLGRLEATTPEAGDTTISHSVDAIVVGPKSTRPTNANSYYAGIAFNHMLNYNNTTTYDATAQGWIGLRLYDTPGSERSYLVFATKNSTSSPTDRPIERMCISPAGNVGIGVTAPAYALDVSGDVRATNFRGALVGNADTATALTTVSKTAWGQTFWTSGGIPASISGDMTNVGDITPSADKQKNLGSESLQFSYVYASRLITNSGNGLRYCSTTGKHAWYNSYTTDDTTKQMELTNSALTIYKDVQGMGGVSAMGIASMAINSVSGVAFAQKVTMNGQNYEAYNGAITLPNYTATYNPSNSGSTTEALSQKGAKTMYTALVNMLPSTSTVAGWGYKKGMVYTTGTPSDSTIQVATGADPTYQYITNTSQSSLVMTVTTDNAAANSYGVHRYIMIYNNRSSATLVQFADQGQGVVGPADSVSIPANSYMEFSIIHPASNAKCMVTWSTPLKNVTTM